MIQKKLNRVFPNFSERKKSFFEHLRTKKDFPERHRTLIEFFRTSPNVSKRSFRWLIVAEWKRRSANVRFLYIRMTGIVECRMSYIIIFLKKIFFLYKFLKSTFNLVGQFKFFITFISFIGAQSFKNENQFFWIKIW